MALDFVVVEPALLVEPDFVVEPALLVDPDVVVEPALLVEPDVVVEPVLLVEPDVAVVLETVCFELVAVAEVVSAALAL